MPIKTHPPPLANARGIIESGEAGSPFKDEEIQQYRLLYVSLKGCLDSKGLEAMV
jgi:hypothetical protein